MDILESRRLVIKSVPCDMTKKEFIETFLKDFPDDLNVFMPKECWNHFRKTKLIFVDFPFPW